MLNSEKKEEAKVPGLYLSLGCFLTRKKTKENRKKGTMQMFGDVDDE